MGRLVFRMLTDIRPDVLNGQHQVLVHGMFGDIQLFGSFFVGLALDLTKFKDPSLLRGKLFYCFFYQPGTEIGYLRKRFFCSKTQKFGAI